MSDDHQHDDRPSVVVHDFSGHPFQVQLARSLASNGFRSTHVYCDSFQTPHGQVGDVDPDTGFRSVAVSTGEPFAKYSMRRRLKHEIEYGRKAAKTIRGLDPDVVISANVPLLAALVFQLSMLMRRIPVVFWQQDVYSVAMAKHLESQGGWHRTLLGKVFIRIERLLLRTSKRVVVIAEDFLTVLDDWKVPREKITVVENWAPLEELPVRPRRNQWSERHGIADGDTVLVYAGTLGLKHQPSALLAVAEEFADQPDVKVFVASEGIGADWLAEALDQGADPTIITQLPFQPYEDLPDMLAAADVLMVLLEPDAGTFSVPSKVLTYHCAGRAILGAMPTENLASRNIVAAGSGVIVETGDDPAFAAAARQLVDDEARRDAMGVAARAHAEAAFDIDVITTRFGALIANVADGRDATLGEADVVPEPVATRSAS
ncbi:MAG: glycosyltransferase family 4 protein [Actinomycetota bacterium]